MPFKLKRREEKITAGRVPALFPEFFEATGVRRFIENYMPGPCSGRAFEAVRCILLLVELCGRLINPGRAPSLKIAAGMEEYRIYLGR